MRKLNSLRSQASREAQQSCTDIAETCTTAPTSPSNQILDSYQAVADGLTLASNGEFLWGFSEGKIVLYFSVMALLWFYDKRLEREQRNREMELEVVEKKASSVVA